MNSKLPAVVVMLLLPFTRWAHLILGEWRVETQTLPEVEKKGWKNKCPLILTFARSRGTRGVPSHKATRWISVLAWDVPPNAPRTEGTSRTPTEAAAARCRCRPATPPCAPHWTPLEAKGNIRDETNFFGAEFMKFERTFETRDTLRKQIEEIGQDPNTLIFLLI